MGLFTTRQLLGYTEQKVKFRALFLELFFRRTVNFHTEEVMLDKITGKTPVAAYVSPVVEGKVLRHRGGETRVLRPGYVKPKHEFNYQQAVERLPGEDPSQLNDPAYRRLRIITDNLKQEEHAIVQVEEMQAVNAVLYGKYTMEGDQFEKIEVDFGRSTKNNITQGSGKEWSKQDRDTFDPTHDIDLYCDQASGLVNIAIMDGTVWRLLNGFKLFREKLDTRRGSNSQLETAVKDLGAVVSFKGYYGDLAIVVAKTSYIAEDGIEKRYLPDGMLVLGNTAADGIRCYGAIQDAQALSEGVVASSRYPKHWLTVGDPAREFTMTQSAPLMVLPDPDEFVALILGREPDISGSAAEIAQRVAEWEEEMQSSGDDVQVMNMDIRERETAAHDVREETSGALTRIRVLTCLHLCGVDGETGESVELADVGRVILIMSSDAKTHVDGGMAVYA